MSSSHQLKLGALISYMAIFINIATGILYTPWVIHSIGQENFGLYTLALSVITLFVFDFGLSSAVTRFIANYLAEGRQDKANNILGLVYRLYIIIDIVLLVVLVGVYFFIPKIYQELTIEEIEKFKVVYSIVAFYSVISLPFIPVNGVLNAHEKFIQVKLCDVLHKLIIVGAMSVCLLVGYGLYALVTVNVVAGVITILFKLWCIHKYTPQAINWKYFNKTKFRELVSFSGWVTVIQVAQRCILTIAPSILGVLSGSSEIAIMGIAITFEGYAITLANAINGMFLPQVSRILIQDNGDIFPLMVRIGRILIYIISLLVFGIICFGQEFIHLWVGNEFHDSYLCTVLIIFPSLFFLPQEIGIQVITVVNRVKKLALVYVIMAVANLIGAALLTPSLGAVGLSMSVCFVYFIRVISLDIILYRDLKIKVSAFFRDTFGKLLIPLFFSFGVGFVINNFIPFWGWIGFGVKIAFFVIAYVLIMYFTAMNCDEKQLILQPLKRILKYNQV